MIPTVPVSELERDFDIRNAVSKRSLACREYWVTESELVRGRASILTEVAYGTGERQRIDIFEPDGQRPQSGWPTLLFVHGGYWQKLSKEDHSFIAEAYTDRGIAVAVVEYTLCPANTVRGITVEVEQAVTHLWTNAETLHLDRNAFVLAGHSAGGHLTAWCMTVNWSTHSLPTDPFLAAVSISGLFDLEPFVPTSVNIALGLTSTEALDVSPLYRTRTTTCPFDAIVGAAETTEFLRQNALLDEMWPDVAARSLAGEDHFTIVTQVGNPESDMFQIIARRFRT